MSATKLLKAVAANDNDQTVREVYKVKEYEIKSKLELAYYYFAAAKGM